LLIASAASLAHKPTAMTWAVAAALPVPAPTAEQVVSEALILHADETVLCTAPVASPAGSSSSWQH
jgi:NADPH:quinone reductase-like Zn-dependent oxidoreductase